MTLSRSGPLRMVPCAVEGKVIRCQNGHVYKVVRTLRECIYGKVRVAQVCRLYNDGLYHETQEIVALKIMSKVRGGCVGARARVCVSARACVAWRDRVS